MTTQAPSPPAKAASEFVSYPDGFTDPAETYAGKQPPATPPRSRRVEAFKRFNKNSIYQAFLTFVSGMPHEGQKPLWKNTPTSVAAVFFATTLLSVAAVSTVIALLPEVNLIGKGILFHFVVVGNMVTTGRLRALHHTILHHASHDDFGKNASRWIGELASLIAFTMPLAEYGPKHKYHHGHTADEGDPELETVHTLGFRPGMTTAEYWRHFWWVMVSPRYLFTNLRRRFRSNFAAEVPFKRRLSVALIQGIPLWTATGTSLATGSIWPILIYLGAWLLPLTWGWHVSLTLYVMGLHVWERPQGTDESRRQLYLQRTGARFFADELPAEGLPIGRALMEWSRYWLRFVYLHLLISRLFCVSGDNSAHDVHHLQMSRLDWANSTYDRPRIVRESRGKDDYWETWNIFEAVGVTFASLAAQPAEAKLAKTPHFNLGEAWHQAEMM